MRERGFTRVFLCGVATDYCVGWSAIDAREAGFAAVVVEDACRAIDLDGSLERAWGDMAAAGVEREQSGAIGGRGVGAQPQSSGRPHLRSNDRAMWRA